nr:hypothetical protein [Fimbriiglobus ruber]
MGVTLPGDYREFIAAYGMADLPNGVRVLNLLDPQECDEARALVDILRDVVDSLRSLELYAESSPGDPQDARSLPFPIYPDACGYPDASGPFPWGTAEHGRATGTGVACQTSGGRWSRAGL